MKGNPVLYKTLVIGVIVLFIGVGVQPAIADIIPNDNNVEYIEITSEFTGIGRKHSVKMTQEEAEELDALFDSIREQLSTAESREEAEKVFKEAVVELDKFGLLGGLSVKQAQRLVTGFYNMNNYLNKKKNLFKADDSIDEYHNSFCFVAGEWINLTSFTRPMLFDFLTSFESSFLYIVWFIFSLYVHIKPIAISQSVSFGIERMVDLGYWVYYPAYGNITTYGMSGAKSWSGSFYGSLGWDGFLFDNRLRGIVGFSGLKINKNYIGFALKVGLQREHP